ncbi:efflux RND transporter periplasmic adaptor subunit [Flavobacterium sp. DGU11]|uniref:Efflux RND transporter periplasmic adaptor subunit n=2 Tax=Flavobacterium arundinis TaxID=3139143 RepID=A0ABU9I1X5_9FLAO
MLAACKNPAEEQQAPQEAITTNTVVLTKAQLQNAAIETSRLSEKNIATVLKLNGKIEVPPQNLISVSAPLGGYLVKTKLLPGMPVRKGEVIAILQDEQYVQLQQDYLTARSRLHFAGLEYNRQKGLNESKAASDKVTQQAEAELANLRILVSALSEKLKLININPENLSSGKISKSITVISTITGFVSKVNINIGKYVSPGDVMFELINPDDIHLNLNVYDKDVALLAIGQKVSAYSNAQPDKKYLCEIILISKDINANGSTEVHCHFKQYDKGLLPGMYMNAEVETLAAMANAVPESAVVSFEGKDYVFIQTAAQHYEMIAITTGTKENGYIALTDAASLKNKAIVTKGAYTLLMKLKNKEE